MKTLFATAVSLLFSIALFAQNGQTDQGNVVIDANTTLGSLGTLSGGGTNFVLTTSDGVTIWNIGGEVGYFVVDDLALKLGLGYGDLDGAGYFSWKVGAKYYVAKTIPLQFDFSGQSGEDVFGDESPTYASLQGGYAIFFGDMVSLEPSLRYSYAFNEFFENVFQVQVGFSIFF